MNIDAWNIKDGLFYEFNNRQNSADHSDELKKTGVFIPDYNPL